MLLGVDKKPQKKTLLVLEVGFQVYKKPLLQALFESEYDLVLLTGLEPQISAEWSYEYFKDIFRFQYTDLLFLDKILAWLDNRPYTVAGVLSFVEPSVHVANRLQHSLGLPVISEFQWKEIRNKYLMRKLLEHAGIVQPRFQFLRNGEIPFAPEMPCVVKPTEMMSSLGVSLVRNVYELPPALAAARTADFWNENLRKLYLDFDQGVLLEEFIDGKEYSVECVVNDGETVLLGITAKTKDSTTSQRFFDEKAFIFPAKDITPEVHARIEDLLINAHRALKLRYTFTHTEIRIRDGIPYIIEINNRIAGGLISKLLENSLKLNLGKTLALLHAGELNTEELRIEQQRKIPETYAISFLTTDKEGRVVKLPEKFPEIEDIVDVDHHVSLNELLIRQGLYSRSRLAHAIFKGMDQISRFDQVTTEYEIQSPIYQKNDFLVFDALPHDLDLLQKIETTSWPKGQAASKETLKQRLHSTTTKHLICFSLHTGKPEGFITYVKLKDFNSSVIYSWDTYSHLVSQTDTFNGNCLYILSISVLPQAPHGTGTALLEAVVSIAKMKNVPNVAYGARLTGLRDFTKHGRSIEDYFKDVSQDKTHEPSIHIGMHLGFKLKHFIPNYFYDPDSLNFGALMHYELH